MKQVLVVDDDALVAALISKRVPGECAVRRAADAEAALGVIRGGARFDIILCRTHLGGRHGGQLLFERMKDECPQQASKIVLFNAIPVGLPPSGPQLWS